MDIIFELCNVSILCFLGAVIGTVVCSMFNTEEPIRYQEPPDDFIPYHSLNDTNRKHKVNKSKSTLYLNILFFFFSINTIFFVNR